MIKILFTKYYPIEELQKELGENYLIESQDFIQSEDNDWQDIQKNIQWDSQNYIVSSVRSASLIKDIPQSANFYIVGELSKDVLEAAGHKVVYCAYYADELTEYIKNFIPDNTVFNFFCSQIRRDTIPDTLKEMGHEVNEIVCYHTTNKIVKIEEEYDAYVFYSPSGVNSFRDQYEIAEKARIFAIGKTTADAVEEQLGKKAEFPDTPDNHALIQYIKTRLNAEK